MAEMGHLRPGPTSSRPANVRYASDRDRSGEDLRRTPIEERKHILAKLLSHSHEGIAFNKHYTGDGAIIHKHACALGCEGIVSKRLGSPYRSGRTDHWVKVKNPEAPAAKHLDEEDWRK
jgi:bifunctional non-homologous end joining protein LigD